MGLGNFLKKVTKKSLNLTKKATNNTVQAATLGKVKHAIGGGKKKAPASEPDSIASNAGEVQGTDRIGGPRRKRLSMM